MAAICPVCKKEITSENREVYKSSNDSEGIALHDYCLNKYVSKPTKYVGKTIKSEKSRTEICPVCNEKTVVDECFSVEGVEGDVEVHTYCLDKFNQNPEKYGGKVEIIEKTEAQIKAESERRDSFQKEIEKREELQQKIEEKSVHVKSFDMPFGDMVGFMVKWSLASIPAFIILFIIFGIFFLIFGLLFF